MDIKVRNKRLAKDIQKGIHKSHKARSARDKAKTKFSQSLKEGVQTGKAYFDYQKVLRELKKNFRVDASNKISRRLSELGLSNLITKNISESDLVKLERLAKFPNKTLKSIAKLRNINNDWSRSEILYALIRSEPIVDEEKHFIESNNEIINKANEARLLLHKTSSFISKNKRSSIRKRLNEIENTKKNR